VLSDFPESGGETFRTKTEDKNAKNIEPPERWRGGVVVVVDSPSSGILVERHGIRRYLKIKTKTSI